MGGNFIAVDFLALGRVSLCNSSFGSKVYLSRLFAEGDGSTALVAQSINVGGDVSISRATLVYGTTHFSGSVSGGFCLSGALLYGADKAAHLLSKVKASSEKYRRNRKRVTGLDVPDFAQGSTQDAIALICGPMEIAESFEADEGFRAVGQLIFNNLEVGGDISFEDASLEGDGWHALLSHGLHVGGDFRVSAQGGRVLSRGKFCLDGSEIQGDLIIHDAKFAGEGYSAFTLQRAVVRGRIDFYNVNFVGALDMDSAKVSGDMSASKVQMQSALNGTELPNVEQRAEYQYLDMGTTVGFAWRARKMCVDGSLLLESEFLAEGIVDFTGARIGKQLTIKSAKIAGNQRGIIPFTHRSNPESLLLLSDAHIAGRLTLSSNEIAGDIDFSGLEVWILQDDNSGYGFSSVPNLILDHFVYQRLETPVYGPPKKVHGSTTSAALQSEGHRGETRPRPGAIAKSRANWLKQSKYYSPQPYVHLAGVLKASGEIAEARQIRVKQRHRESRLSIKHALELPDMGSSLLGRIGRRAYWPFQILAAAGLSFAQLCFNLLFGYGYKPAQALVTLTASFVIGWLFFAWANGNGWMTIVQQPVASVVRDGAPAAPQIEADSMMKLACNGAIRPSLYALDVFIPLLDLREEAKCEIGLPDVRSEGIKPDKYVLGFPSNWSALSKLNAEFSIIEMLRYLKALYAIAGWLIISLSILTFSGVLQRRDQAD